MQGDKTPGISDTVRSTCIFSLDTQQPVCRFTPQGCGSGFSLLPRVTQAILQTTKTPTVVETKMRFVMKNQEMSPQSLIARRMLSHMEATIYMERLQVKLQLFY